MWNHTPETDLIGTIRDLHLPFHAAALMLDGADRIDDRAIRAFLTGVILSSEPHRYALLPGHPDTPYDHPGGRVLRAGVMSRAVILLAPAIPRVREDMIAAVFVATLSPGSVEPASRPCFEKTRRWLVAWSRDEASHLAGWGCTEERVRRIATLATQAEGSDRSRRGRGSGSDLTMALACHAARLAGPLDRDRPLRQRARWVDPRLPDITARPLLHEALRNSTDMASFTEPGRRDALRATRAR